MMLAGGRPITRSPSRRSRGLRDIYEVPTSVLRGSSPLIPRHSPQLLRVRKTNGKSRAQSALRVSRRRTCNDIRYERIINGADKNQEHIVEEMGPAKRNFPGDIEQIYSPRNSGASEVEPQQDGIPEVAKQRLMEMALEGLYVAGDLSSVDNGGDNATSVCGRRKAVTQQATIPVECQSAKTRNRRDFNIAGSYPENRIENEEFHTMQRQDTPFSTLEKGRLSKEKDIPALIFTNAKNNAIGDKASSELDMHAIDLHKGSADIASEKRRIEAIEDLQMNEDGTTDFLVKWEGVDYEFATWEHEETVVSSAPRLVIQYLKAMIFADKRIEQAERDKDLKCNQLSIDHFIGNDISNVEIGGHFEHDNATIDVRSIRHDDIIEDSQSFGEDELIRDEQLLRSESAIEFKLSRTVERPALKRSRGRLRMSDRGTSITRASRRVTTEAVDHFEILGPSMRNGFRQASNISSESESRLSQSDFSMPSAGEVLEAARELATSRESHKGIARKTTTRRKHRVEKEKSSLTISTDGLHENPYEKYYLSDKSNRRVKSRGVSGSEYGGVVRSVHPTTNLVTNEPEKANERLIPGNNTAVVRRRGRPPGSRNKNARPAKIVTRNSSPVLGSGGIRKARPGRRRATSSENNPFSSVR